MVGILVFDYSKLRGRIVEKYGSNYEFAAALGLKSSLLSARLNQTTPFKMAEIKRAQELLDIDPAEIGQYFFTLKVR